MRYKIIIASRTKITAKSVLVSFLRWRTCSFSISTISSLLWLSAFLYTSFTKCLSIDMCSTWHTEATRKRLGFLVGSESNLEIVLSTVPALSAKSLWVIPCSCRFSATSSKKFSQFLSSSKLTNSSPVFWNQTHLSGKHDKFDAQTATFVSTYRQCNLLQLNCTKYLLNLEGFLFDNNRQKRRNTNGLEHGVRAAYFTNDT